MRKEKTQVNFRLEQLDVLRSLQVQTGVPVSEIVRRAVDEYLARHGNVPKGMSVEAAIGALATNARHELRRRETTNRRLAGRTVRRSANDTDPNAAPDRAAK